MSRREDGSDIPDMETTTPHHRSPTATPLTDPDAQDKE